MNAAAPALATAATLLALLLVRRRATAVRIVVEGALLLGIGAMLLSRGVTPDVSPWRLGLRPDAPWLRALAIAWWLIAARVGTMLIALARGHDAQSRAASLFSDLLGGGIYLAAVVIVLNSVLDIPVRGLVATSGVIAIVLGLALQNTLSDLFSGIAVGIEQPIHVGDRVGVGDHPEGLVVQMNWRAIQMRTDGEDLLTIPNSVVAKSAVVNRSRPTRQRRTTVDVPVRSRLGPDGLLSLVEQAFLLCPEILREPLPAVVVKAIDGRRLLLEASFSTAGSGQLAAARGELLRQIRKLFRAAGAEAGRPPALVETLRDLAPFECLSDAQVATLADAATTRRLNAGSTMTVDGTGPLMLVTIAGVLEADVAPASRSGRAIARIGPGECVGPLDKRIGERSAATLRALTDCRLVEIGREAIEALVTGDAAFAAALDRLARRDRELVTRDAAVPEEPHAVAATSLLDVLRRALRPTRS